MWGHHVAHFTLKQTEVFRGKIACAKSHIQETCLSPKSAYAMILPSCLGDLSEAGSRTDVKVVFRDRGNLMTLADKGRSLVGQLEVRVLVSTGGY